MSIPNHKEIELICVIINCGKGSKIIKFAKERGVLGGTIIIGKGTIRNKFLAFLELTEIRREIVLMIAERDIAQKALEALDKKLDLKKPNNGIAFTTSVAGVLGTKALECEIEEKRGVDNSMYNAIFVVVDKGKAEIVIEAASNAGSRGGTIINARGSGVHETSKVFGMEVEPEKEIVLILSKKDATKEIVLSIREELKIDEPGNGIIFIQEVNKTYGLY